jgi:para-nitrobenzyl esterase
MKSSNRGRRCVLPLGFALGIGGCGSDDRKRERPSDDVPEAEIEPTKAKIDDGALEGDVLGGSVRFLKLPFAKPPVGDLRWKAAQKNDPWKGTRHEPDFGSPCPQPPSQQSAPSQDEDCLYLNVWRPNESVTRAPVIVWIHGGGFTTGSAADKIPLTMDRLWYDGQAFAERGVVVVTINYRLGVLGFFAHHSLGDEGSPVGNQGLLDQQHALRWVHDNIEAFGGDPKNVTIAGESAGSGSVCMHTVSPGSRGLFHRAISESGGCTSMRGTDRDALDASIDKFAADHGCTGAGALECLRALPVSELVSAEPVDRTMGMAALRAAFSFGAVIDGKGGFLPEPPVDLIDRGEVAKVPYILGTNNEEAQLYTSLDQTLPKDAEEYEAELVKRYGDFASRVLDMYPLSKFGGDARKAITRVSTDSGLVCGTLDTARHQVKAGLPVYMYNFNIPWSILPDLLGVSHASEISHVFGSPYNESDANVDVAVAMNTYWSTFAKTGDPNYEGAPAEWPRFEPTANEDDLRIQFDPGFEILHGFRKAECQLWREYTGDKGPL